tara:strand:+ start:4030 stop:4479 length:450 start_codon:yes stop_codon:yes gene_type:complete
MPYSDPAKKKAYQDAYNKKYYETYKVAKNLVGKATNSKTALRQKKRLWLIHKLGNHCESCGIKEPDFLQVKTTDKTPVQKWNDSYYKSIYDYSWDNLETLYPSLKIICEVCLQKNQKSAKKTLTTLFEEKDDLPRGYTLDEDLEPESNL